MKIHKSSRAAETICCSLDKDALTPLLQARPALAELLSQAYAQRFASLTARIESLPRPGAVSETSAPDLLRKIRLFFGIEG